MGAAKRKSKPPRPKSASPTPPVGSKGSSQPTHKDMVYLTRFLPEGWESYFSTVKAGKYWGLSNTCPICGERPPTDLKYGHRRWRWLAAHMAGHKSALRRT